MASARYRNRESIVLRLPTPIRQRYEVELPADAELIITCPAGLEPCGAREPAGSYRVWTRKAPKGKA